MINENLKQFLGEYQNLPIQESQIFTFQLASNDYLFLNTYYPQLKLAIQDSAKQRAVFNYLADIFDLKD